MAYRVTEPWRTPMLRFRLSFVAVVLSLTVPFAAFAQQTLTEKIEVRVVGIDVVVTDRAGNVISGLTKDDFVLIENKTPQTIVNFYEATPEIYVTAPENAPSSAQPASAQPASAAPLPPPRRVVLYI